MSDTPPFGEFPILFDQEVAAAFEAVAGEEGPAAGVGEDAPAFDHPGDVLPEGRKDGAGPDAEDGVARQRNVAHDDAHGAFRVAGRGEDRRVDAEGGEVEFLVHEEVGRHGRVGQ